MKLNAIQGGTGQDMYTRLALNISINCLAAIFCYNIFADTLEDSRAVETSGYQTGISPGLELLIDQSINNKSSKNALLLLDNEIKKNPRNVGLLYEKASIYADQGKWQQTTELLKQIFSIQPNHPKAKKLLQIIEKKKQAEPHNEVGIDTDEAYVSDLASYWNYSSLHYYRLTDMGKFGGRFNYANRYGTTGKQFQIEAYPKFNHNMFATLTFGYADTTQILFPSLQYMIEGYLDVANGFEFSLGQGGQKYIRFSNQKIFNYTGTIGKYIGNSFIWIRPHHFTPKNTEFYELGFRKYFTDVNNYIGVIISAGKLPDIGDLPPIDQMIVINQKGIGLNGQISVKKTVFLRGGIGYVKQIFPSNLKRDITDGNIGLVWQI